MFVSSIAKTPEAYFLNILLGEHVLGLLPKGTHEYDQFINQETCQKYLEAIGIDTIAKSGVTVTNPFSMEMGEIACLRTNYMMVAKK